MSLLAAALAVTGCASASSIRWDRALEAPDALAERVFVMEPLVEGTAAPGNAARNIPVVTHQVRERILAIVRGRSTVVDRVTTPGHRISALSSYRAAMVGRRLTPEELDAASAAFEAGATHLLVPTILRWTVMRTDDPIGTFILPHNQVAIDLRLMRLDPPAIAGDVVFSNRAHFTLNQSPMQLLGREFRRAILQLVSPGRP